MTEGRQKEPAVPVGLEQVLLMVGVAPKFAEALRAEPEAVLTASGVALTATERTILRTVPPERLERMAAELAAVASEPTRRAFLGQASVVVLALGAGAGLAAGCGDKKSATGKSSAAEGRGQNMAAMAMERQRKVKRSYRTNAPTGIRPGPWPHTTVGEPKITGPLDKKVVKQKLKAYAITAQRCWFRNGRHSPKGTIQLELTVDATGKVKRASLGTAADKLNAIESCILGAVQQWRFPASKPRPTKIQVSYTFESRY